MIDLVIAEKKRSTYLTTARMVHETNSVRKSGMLMVAEVKLSKSKLRVIPFNSNTTHSSQLMITFKKTREHGGYLQLTNMVKSI